MKIFGSFLVKTLIVEVVCKPVWKQHTRFISDIEDGRDEYWMWYDWMFLRTSPTQKRKLPTIMAQDSNLTNTACIRRTYQFISWDDLRTYHHRATLLDSYTPRRFRLYKKPRKEWRTAAPTQRTNFPGTFKNAKNTDFTITTHLPDFTFKQSIQDMK